MSRNGGMGQGGVGRQVDTRVVVSNGIEVKNAIARKSNKASTIKLSSVARTLLSATNGINNDERLAYFAGDSRVGKSVVTRARPSPQPCVPFILITF